MLLFLTLPKSVYAEVVINEILPDPTGTDDGNEWVELYNQSASQIDLTGYKLKDASDHEQSLSGSITGNGYLVFIALGSFSINNDNETIKLFDPSSILIDSYNYLNSTEGKSWGRYPDGGSFSSSALVPTSGQPNQIPSTPSPTPTITPSPTPISTLTPSPTATPKPTPTKTPSPKATSTPTAKPTVTDEPDTGLVLSDVVISTPTPTDKVKGISTTNKKPMIAIIFIFTGVLFLGYVGYLLYNMNHQNNGHEFKKDETNDSQGV